MFLILNIEFYIVARYFREIARKPRDNCDAKFQSQKGLSRGFRGKKTKLYNILTIITNSLLLSPPPPPREQFRNLLRNIN